MLLPDENRLPRDPKLLLREVDAALKIKDIEKVQRYKDQIEVKWWESGIIVLLFISGLGFIVTVYKLIPAEHSPLFWFIFFWFALFIMTLVATLEFMYLKFRALRQLQELDARMIEDLRLHKEDRQPHNTQQ